KAPPPQSTPEPESSPEKGKDADQAAADHPAQSTPKFQSAAPEFVDQVREPAPEMQHEALSSSASQAVSWREMIPALKLSPLLQEQLRHGQALCCAAEKVDLLIEPRYLPFIIKEKVRLLQALSDYFGQAPQLSITALTEESGVGSLIAEEEARIAARRQEAQARVTNDPRIRQFTEVLGVQVESITFRDQDQPVSEH
ncbi:MAG: DNA polymerase III subunit gamma/tau, partial [Acidithiobacillaceae bacterium]|nr:DNA polymerase III subunit gamma/tau [Acidithiobacillaceae bacterium]